MGLRKGIGYNQGMETRKVRFVSIHVEKDRELRFPYNLVVTSVGPREEVETWDRTELRCPNCGAQDVWAGPGDGYEGESHLCLSCAAHFYITMLYKREDKDPERIAQLKATP